jgi:aspartyl/asparaginyl-tRNA synthetase
LINLALSTIFLIKISFSQRRIPSQNRKMPRLVGWVEARNPTNTLGFTSLRDATRSLLPRSGTLNPTCKKMVKVLKEITTLSSMQMVAFKTKLQQTIT